MDDESDSTGINSLETIDELDEMPTFHADPIHLDNTLISSNLSTSTSTSQSAHPTYPAPSIPPTPVNSPANPEEYKKDVAAVSSSQDNQVDFELFIVNKLNHGG
ncbi:hypothetical protein Fot_11124 [Forsythia ovata]|uniref:Uncharacterized protein n=1 Tax=Forsythia ovata TaxID=205694 RepID=A0ABD1WIU2_9LAMI